jgi:hypothetical protein
MNMERKGWLFLVMGAVLVWWWLNRDKAAVFIVDKDVSVGKRVLRDGQWGRWINGEWRPETKPGAGWGPAPPEVIDYDFVNELPV